MKKLRVGTVVATLAALICVPGALSAPPSNDGFSNPVSFFGVYGEHLGTNAEATVEAGEPDHAGVPGGASVWFSWTPTRSGIVAIDTCDSDFDTLLAIYTGTLGALTEVAADDDACEAEGGSAVEVFVWEYTQYRIVVDGVDGETGTFALWFAMVPTNDDFAGADVLSGESPSRSGYTLAASHEVGEPLHAGARGTGSVWYAWTPPRDLRATVDTCGSSGDTLLAVYTGSAVDALSLVGANDDAAACGLNSSVVFDAFAGATYWIAVDGKAALQYFELDFRAGPPLLPRNLSPPTITGAAVANGTLEASPGTWVHASSFSYAWFACTSLSACTAIDPSHGGDGERLKIPIELVGRRIRLHVTGHGSAGQFIARSELSGPVRPGSPVNTAAPVIEGAPIVGRTLSATAGTWDLVGARLATVRYQWQWLRCSAPDVACREVDGWELTTYLYNVASADVGSVIQVRVTMTTEGGSTSATARATQPAYSVPRAAQQRRCVVPQLIGKRLPPARKMLSRARCKLGAARKVYSARRIGVIVRQRPKPRTRLRAGGKVTVFVSKGRRR
jgi:hypothetical protein